MSSPSSMTSRNGLSNETETKWVLNCRMKFLDGSDQEKFFFTYLETSNKWNRVTVSCDYRQPDQGSLEHGLKSEANEHKRSEMIYGAIRDTLPQLKLYDTVTNLKLKTSEGNLSITLTEDVNEIICYPSSSVLNHLQRKMVYESSVDFYSHISCFVYQVLVEDKLYIKKEIPGPGAVERFLGEANAMHALHGSNHITKLEGIIVDQTGESIKGLLISNAEQGALVDLLKNYKNSDWMRWNRRERWARQIVEGLTEVHKAGLVHGDFTLSNIVVDGDDDVKIIDFNRRGCPIGWEPPEFVPLLERKDQISAHIDAKSDVFQLGMVLWALAEQNEEPERRGRPLSHLCNWDNVPEYFKKIVRNCLREAPEERPSAEDILQSFSSQV